MMDFYDLSRNSEAWREAEDANACAPGEASFRTGARPASPPEPVRAAPPQEAPARTCAPWPNITIRAFCETAGLAATLEAAAADRLMLRTELTVEKGGLAAAIALFRTESTPNLVIVESGSETARLLEELEALAAVCDVGSKVVVIGRSNDIGLYRTLLARGVSDYLVGPLDAGALIEAIGAIYRDGKTEKVGQVYAFVGARGGVGSSTVAHNVAASIAGLDLDVILADMDLPFGTAALDFDLGPGQGLMETIEGADRLDAVLLDRLLARHGPRLSLLSAPATLGRAYDLDEGAFETMLDITRAKVPALVLDIPHLWSSWARKTLVSADEIVITATPDLASLRNTRNLVEFLREARPNDAPPRLVLNQVGMPKRPELKARDFTAALKIAPAACIPFEPALFGRATNEGRMLAELAPKAVPSERIADIARLLTRREDAERARRGKGLLSAFVKRQPTPAA